MNDVTFGRSGPYGDSDMGVAIPGRSLMSTNALFFSDFSTVVYFCASGTVDKRQRRHTIFGSVRL